MTDLISRHEAVVKAQKLLDDFGSSGITKEFADMIARSYINDLPSAQPTLRERALMLLLNWAVECDFGYDNFPEEYERYKDEIEDMGYIDGMIYIAEKEVERNG